MRGQSSVGGRRARWSKHCAAPNADMPERRSDVSPLPQRYSLRHNLHPSRRSHLTSTRDISGWRRQRRATRLAAVVDLVRRQNFHVCQRTDGSSCLRIWYRIKITPPRSNEVHVPTVWAPRVGARSPHFTVLFASGCSSPLLTYPYRRAWPASRLTHCLQSSKEFVMSTVLSASTSRLAHEAARHHKLWADRLHLRVNQLVAAVLLLGLEDICAP